MLDKEPEFTLFGSRIFIEFIEFELEFTLRIEFALTILLIYGFFAGDFAAGASFLFTPDFSALTGHSVLVAMGHAFFTLSLGMGAIMAYGAYMPQKASIGKTILVVAFFDSAVAIISGLIIFSIVEDG